jgi:CRP-like cAMP-binding protein
MRAVLEARRRVVGDAGFSTPPASNPPQVGATIGLVERVLFLRRLLTYGRARVEALAELGRLTTEVRVPAGSQLFAAGDPSSNMLLLWSGVVTGETREGQRFRFGPESVVGGIDAIAGVPRWYTATAETDVVALRSDVSHLIDVIEDNPDMGLGMLRSASRVLADLEEKLGLPDADVNATGFLYDR